jgi:4-hydroxy-tetrahydrodipicolinate synthase
VINDNTNLPVAIYDGGAGIELGLEQLEKIGRELEHIKYCKIYLEKPEKIAQINERCKGSLIAWAGHDRLTYLMLLYGAKGMTSAASNVVPKENTDMFNLVRAGKIDDARQIFLSKIAPLNSIAFYTALDYIAAYKLSAYWMGLIDTPVVRKPLLQLDELMQKELRAALKFIGKL